MFDYKSRYGSRYNQVWSALYAAGEMPADYYLDLGIGYNNFRQIIFRLHSGGLIKTIRRDHITSYVLTHKGKKIDPNESRQIEEYSPVYRLDYSVKSRLRRIKYARLYAALDKASVEYSSAFGSLVDPLARLIPAWEYKNRYAADAKSISASVLMAVLIRDRTASAVYWAEHDAPRFSRVETIMSHSLAVSAGQNSMSAIIVCRDTATLLRVVEDEIKAHAQKPSNLLRYGNYEHVWLLSTEGEIQDGMTAILGDNSRVWDMLVEENGIDASRYRKGIYSGYIGDRPVDFMPAIDLREIRSYLARVRVDYRDLTARKTIFCYRHDAVILRAITAGVKDLDIIPITLNAKLLLSEDD